MKKKIIISIIFLVGLFLISTFFFHSEFNIIDENSGYYFSFNSNNTKYLITQKDNDTTVLQKKINETLVSSWKIFKTNNSKFFVEFQNQKNPNNYRLYMKSYNSYNYYEINFIKNPDNTHDFYHIKYSNLKKYKSNGKIKIPMGVYYDSIVKIAIKEIANNTILSNTINSKQDTVETFKNQTKFNLSVKEEFLF